MFTRVWTVKFKVLKTKYNWEFLKFDVNIKSLCRKVARNLNAVSRIKQNLRYHKKLLLLNSSVKLPSRYDTHMVSLKNFQFLRPSTPYPSTFKIPLPPWPWTTNFKQTPLPILQMIPCMWTNKIKTKTKPNHVEFKLTTRSIVCDRILLFDRVKRKISCQ